MDWLAPSLALAFGPPSAFAFAILQTRSGSALRAAPK